MFLFYKNKTALKGFKFFNPSLLRSRDFYKYFLYPNIIRYEGVINREIKRDFLFYSQCIIENIQLYIHPSDFSIKYDLSFEGNR